MVVATLASPSPARAGGDAIDDARKHFAEGVKRYQEGDFEGARVLFEQANAEHHAPPIVYNIARAEERLGHPQAAIDQYDTYIAEAGENGEFTQAAVLALARIRKSSRQLRIETKPPGARVFVDGSPTRDPAPTRVLVPAGRHHVVAEGDGWRAEADVEAGAAAVENVMLERPDGAAASPTTTPSTSTTGPNERTRPAEALPPAPDGFIFGAEFTVVPHRFDRTAARRYSSFGIAAGVIVEAGYAPADDFVVLGRTLVSVGSKGAPATTLAAIGVAMSYRVRKSVWIGAAFMGGRALLPGAIEPQGNEQRRFDTDYVFCPTLEVSVAVLTKPYGQWLVSIFPGYYFASPADNDVFFVPVGFGLRTF
ncbi:MAG: TonB-dependent receptor [Labilithrix sp.]|nr:TonB-dependent receptor [Labilithrix sp.]